MLRLLEKQTCNLCLNQVQILQEIVLRHRCVHLSIKATFSSSGKNLRAHISRQKKLKELKHEIVRASMRS